MAEIPFDMSYVLKVTTRHMRKSIDISIKKTSERLPELIGNPEKSLEWFNTLGILHTMRKNLDDFQVKNSTAFKGE